MRRLFKWSHKNGLTSRVLGESQFFEEIRAVFLKYGPILRRRDCEPLRPLTSTENLRYSSFWKSRIGIFSNFPALKNMLGRAE